VARRFGVKAVSEVEVEVDGVVADEEVVM